MRKECWNAVLSKRGSNEKSYFLTVRLKRLYLNILFGHQETGNIEK